MSNPCNKIDLLRFTPTDSRQTLSDITMKTGKFPVGLLGFVTAQPNLLLVVGHVDNANTVQRFAHGVASYERISDVR